MNIVEEEFSISRPQGSLPVFSARPEPEGSYPGLILIHEIFGVNEHIKDLCRRFARESYAVFAPDLFAFASSDLPDRGDLNAMRTVWGSINDEQLFADLFALFNSCRKTSYVKANSIGAIGYCMGGAIAFMFACRNPLLAWVVDYYGRIYYQDLTNNKPRHPITYTGGLNCPFLGLFAGVDELIPESHIQDLQKKLLDLGKSSQIKVYPTAKHAFFNDQREFYHYDAASDAWKLTLAFMAANSGQDS